MGVQKGTGSSEHGHDGWSELYDTHNRIEGILGSLKAKKQSHERLTKGMRGKQGDTRRQRSEKKLLHIDVVRGTGVVLKGDLAFARAEAGYE